MSRVDGRVVRGQKVQLKKLLSAKNKVFGATKNHQKNNLNFKIFATLFLTLAMSSKLDINIFGNFKVSSLVDTGILPAARAATSTTTTMKLNDLPIGGVINLGAYNYVKIADNQFMQTEVAACPDGKTVAGKYVKCFEDSSDYTQTCTGSYYCNTSNTSWNSSTGKCDSSVTCPAGSTYCGDNSSWDATSSKCIGTAGSSSCGSGTEWDNTSNTCVIRCDEHATRSGGSCVCDSGYVTTTYAVSYSTGGECSVAIMQDWTGCSSLATNATTTLYDTVGKKAYTIKKFADGNCYTYDDVSTSSKWSNAKTLCSNIPGWSLPTDSQFSSLISAVGAANMNSVWCGSQCSSRRYWWSATMCTGVCTDDGPYVLKIDSSSTYVSAESDSSSYRVRCIKD